MAFPSSTFVSFIVGILILAYLSTFVLFAIIRILFGVSIQRLWWSGLRHISFTPREGLRIDVRGLRLTLHRPTFAQPTWVSVVFEELKLTVDLKLLGTKSVKKSRWTHWRNGSRTKVNLEQPSSPKRPVTPDRSSSPQVSSPAFDTDVDTDDAEYQRSRTWERLMEMKEKIKRLHRKIHYIRLVDLVASNSSLVILDVGSIEVASFTMAVDTRRKTVDRMRLFRHKAPLADTQRPAEWIFTVRSILFSPDGKESSEILDHALMNVHGLLYQKLDGLRDASIALKLGRVNLPYDDIRNCTRRIEEIRKAHPRKDHNQDKELSYTDIMEELEKPGSKEDAIVQTVSDSKEFVASILRGIQEVQFAVSFFGLTKRIEGLQSEKVNKPPVYVNFVMKEVGLDLLRLDQNSPAHLMYFNRDDVAHQALVTAISIGVGIDDGHEHPERLLYIPMVTATLRTTLPSKTIQFSRQNEGQDQNSNILFANVVVTSPSIDLDPRHLPLILSLVENALTDRRRSPSTRSRPRHRLFSRLLPKASIKLSIHEPVVRVALPPIDKNQKESGHFDLLISAMSSMSLDIESSHSPGAEMHYSLMSTYRVTSHHFYYQTASAQKYDLLTTDTFEIKVELVATPDVSVYATVNAQTFCVSMVRPEISEGVRQIVTQLRYDTFKHVGRSSNTQKGPSFLRKIPAWLIHVKVHGTDFHYAVAGTEADVAEHPRGVAVHLAEWSAEYKADRHEEPAPRSNRRRIASRSGEDMYLRNSPSPSRRPRDDNTDGRRLAIHTRDLEVCVLETENHEEETKFFELPHFEIAWTTSTDNQGPLLHVNCFARRFFVHYALHRHYALGVAMTVLRKSFARPQSRPPTPVPPDRLSPLTFIDDRPRTPSQRVEVTTYDFKAGFVQVKAAMPADPALMLQMFDLKAGRHRWANPFVRTHLVRLYAAAPNLKNVWARVISMRNNKIDYRHSRRKYGTGFTDEQSVDIASDAIRVAVPHQLVVHKIFDNATNVVKTIEQLHHRFSTGTDEYILAKRPQGPKRVPKISLRTQAFLFEIEDSYFEWKLGLIYLQGLQEQQQRLAREDAFRVKEEKIREADAAYEKEKRRARSTARQSAGRKHKRRSSEEIPLKQRSQSADPTHDTTKRGRGLHYDNEGATELSDTARRSIQEARNKLNQFHAVAWKRRIDSAKDFVRHAMSDIRSVVWGLDELPEGVEQDEQILAIPQRPALLAAVLSDLTINIDRPSFPINEYPSFLHRMGKGMPFDMQYGLLIPMHLTVAVGEARAALRDYPLPFLHVPPLKAGQSLRVPSLLVKTDFVIAEEFRNEESIRHVEVVVVPPHKDEQGHHHKGLKVDVRRTVSAVKTYSDFTIEVNTSLPTKITWGMSYQPAIQDTMQVVENFTKPPIDPSERVGFWDKIRLSFHSKFNILWKGDGDVHLILKGSRDPYHVTGSGAGFVMCWRNNVHWRICQDPDPKKFMTVNSGEYVLAVPDFSKYARRNIEHSKQEFAKSAATDNNWNTNGRFKKVVMKLSGNVQWLAGLVFEQSIGNGKRSLQFKPHYEVVLKNPKYAKEKDGLLYDAFRGFRSHHIHLSVAIAAPVDRDWNVSNLKPSKNYNSIHLSPRSFSHFFAWWSMFSGNMALPVRQGKLWPGPEKSSKKFGRHLASIKYNLLLSPLYVSHIYKHKDVEEYGQNVVSATGLKIKLDSFMLDLHQRREEFRHQIPGGKQAKTTGMRINQAQLDFISADVRAISQTIKGTGPDDIDEATDETLASYQQDQHKADIRSFTIPDADTAWVDMDDFVEIDWILPAESNPDTRILPLAFAPRFTYFRQTDHHGIVHGDPMRSSPFGNEDTHYCVMSARNDPRRVQCDLIQERLDRIKEQLEHNLRAVGEQELKVIRDMSGSAAPRKKLEAFQQHQEMLVKKQKFLHAMHKVLSTRIERNDLRAVADLDDHEVDQFFEAHEKYDPLDPEVQGMDSAPFGDDIGDFNNRFIVHNVQLKWNNSLRNIILRYIHQVRQRRGLVYYMSQRAVKFILDIVEEQKSKREGELDSVADQVDAALRDADRSDSLGLEEVESNESSIKDRIQQLLDDGKRFVMADDPKHAESKNDLGKQKQDLPDQAGGNGEEIAKEFTAQNSYHFRLVAPQIQLQSEKNRKAAVLVTSKGMSLKVIQIMDKDRVTDDVSGLVQRRFTAAMDSLQVFVANSRAFSSDLLKMYSANRYGSRLGSFWPPWVPLEAMFDFNVDPFGFSRVVQRTSASLRFDKFNTLRLKYNDDITTGKPGETPSKAADDERRMDHLWVEFPKLLAKCDSTQYYALYIIVLDLLLYSEPLEKTREQKLEKILLATDLTDLSDAPAFVTKLQEKIRTLLAIRTQYQINETNLTRQQWKERVLLERDISTCEDELFFTMKAITTSQRRLEQPSQSSATSQVMGMLKWDIFADSIVWHLVRGIDESLVEMQLRRAIYHRTDNKDGSNINEMEIDRIEGFNLLPNAMYPQMIAPYVEGNQDPAAPLNDKMVVVKWQMLKAIAGIPVIQDFEVKMHPLRIQLEREVGVKLFEYIFPGMTADNRNGDSSPFMLKHFLPAHQEADEGNEEAVSGGDTSSSPQEYSGTDTAAESSQGAGDLSLRLQPTLALAAPQRLAARSKHNGYHQETAKKHFYSSSTDTRRLGGKSKKDGDSWTALRPDPTRRNSSMSTHSANQKDGGSSELARRFAMHRTNSESSTTSKMVKTKDKDRSQYGDVNEMLSRASKYIAFSRMHVPSVTLCLSYKDKGTRNIITDVHDLVFITPEISWLNKTWSNYEVFQHLKSKIIRSLVSHTGSIIGNKFRGPNRAQQLRLREVANSSILLGSGSTPTRSSADLHSPATSTFPPSSEAHSIKDLSGVESDSQDDAALSGLESATDDDDYSMHSEGGASLPPGGADGRPSFNSGRGSEFSSQYPDSMSSSMNSRGRSSNGRPLTAESTKSGKSGRWRIPAELRMTRVKHGKEAKTAVKDGAESGHESERSGRRYKSDREVESEEGEEVDEEEEDEDDGPTPSANPDSEMYPGFASRHASMSTAVPSNPSNPHTPKSGAQTPDSAGSSLRQFSMTGTDQKGPIRGTLGRRITGIKMGKDGVLMTGLQSEESTSTIKPSKREKLLPKFLHHHK